MLQVGIPGIGDGKKVQLGPQLMYSMNVAQLQVVVNDLHAQIESEYGRTGLSSVKSKLYRNKYFLNLNSHLNYLEQKSIHQLMTMIICV